MIKDLIYIRKEYKTKKGETKQDIQFYLVLENGARIRISPYVNNFDEDNAWSTFRELILVGHEDK